MQNKIIRYSIFILALAFLAYKSVYFKKLDEVALASSKGFDAKTYSRNFYDIKLIPRISEAVDINRLMKLLQTNPDSAFNTYSNALAIGNIRYFLVQGQGTVSSIDEDMIRLNIQNDSSKKELKIATEFVYGNAIRDASGLVNLNDFTNTADFNSVSEEINKIVRKDVVPSFKAKAQAGNLVHFSGAFEVNRKHMDIDSIEIIPVQLSVIK